MLRTSSGWYVVRLGTDGPYFHSNYEDHHNGLLCSKDASQLLLWLLTVSWCFLPNTALRIFSSMAVALTWLAHGSPWLVYGILLIPFYADEIIVINSVFSRIALHSIKYAFESY